MPPHARDGHKPPGSRAPNGLNHPFCPSGSHHGVSSQLPPRRSYYEPAVTAAVANIAAEEPAQVGAERTNLVWTDLVDVLVAHGALGLHQVIVELVIDVIGKGLAHGMGAHLAGGLVGHGRYTENLPCPDFADRLIDPLAALKHKRLCRTVRPLA